MIISKRLAFRLTTVALLTAFGACSKADTAPPVATVSFNASKIRVPLGSPIDLTYKFNVAPGAAINGDYRVFVHLLDADGANMWTDDHEPPIPTSKWRPGQEIQYTRTRFMPVLPYLGEVTVQIGLYHGDERLPLAGMDPADRASTSRAYKVGTLQLLPQSENIFVIYKSGWHPPEFAPENPTLEWQWTQKQAVLTLRNPRQDVTFFVEYDARIDLFDKAQEVTVLANDKPVNKFLADSSSMALLRIPITAAQLGTGEMVELRLDLDRTFVPAKLPAGGRDSRELGIRVYHAFVGPAK
jgi:hypothetical protein